MFDKSVVSTQIISFLVTASLVRFISRNLTAIWRVAASEMVCFDCVRYFYACMTRFLADKSFLLEVPEILERYFVFQ